MRRSILDPVQLDGGRKHGGTVGGPGRIGTASGTNDAPPAAVPCCSCSPPWCGAFAAFVAATGGIDTQNRGNRRPFAILGAPRHGRPGPGGRRAVLPSGTRCWTWGPLASRSVVPLLAAWALFAALCFGTYAAGGADSFGYLSQAQLFAQGRLTDTMPRHEGFDWPDVPATLTPLAYTRNAVPDVLVPVYPPGLSMMMAPLTLIHANARVPAGAVVRRADRVAHGRARPRAERTGRRRARGAARRREPDVSAAGGAADERRAGRGAVAVGPGPRAPAVDGRGDSRRRRRVAGDPRPAEPGAAGAARRRGVRHGDLARSHRRRVLAPAPVEARDLGAAGGDRPASWRSARFRPCATDRRSGRATARSTICSRCRTSHRTWRGIRAG